MMLPRRLYRALLRLLPEDLRDAHGTEMEEMFAEVMDATRDRGMLPWLAAGLGAISDLALRAPYEHWRRRNRYKDRPMRFVLFDLRFAARTFIRQKGATALVLLTLTLAVAANTAVFALLDGLFLRPFPFVKPERLVYLNEQAPKWNLEFTGINYPDFDTWRKSVRSFEGMALMDGDNVNVADGSRVERIQAARVTYDFPTVLGIKPVLGRTFTRDEDRPKGPPVVVLGYALWQNRFAGASDVVGKTLRINSVPHTIVGVIPPEGEFPAGAQLWLPLAGDPTQPYQSYSYDGVGRLKPGVTVEAARRDLFAAHQPLWRATDTAHVVSPRIMPLRDHFVSDYLVIGKALGAGVVLVLLIACANVAGAMLARGIVRKRELGIRLALGASVARVGRQLLTESLLLAAIAGGAGTLLGWWGLRVLVASAPDQLPRWVTLTPDLRTILFSVAIILVTTLLFGLVPALQVRRQDVRGALAAAGSRLTGSLSQRRLLDVLVVIEIALAAVLLAGGGLLIRAYREVRGIEPGFRLDNVATFRLSLPEAKYPSGRKQKALYDAVLARLAALPGVEEAGAITCPPFGCHWGGFLDGEGAAPRGPNGSNPVILIRIASGDYFRAMAIPLEHGRFFSDQEWSSPKGMRPVVVNERFTRLLWPNVDDATGRRIRFQGDTSARWMTIVGVTKDERHYGLANPARPGIYMPMGVLDTNFSQSSFAFTVHTHGDPAALTASMRTAVNGIDPELPLYQVSTMRAALNQSLALRRTLVAALAAFAAIALVLAIGGIYAVLSYIVGHRRHEIGIRLALGAQRAEVIRLVVRQGVRLIAIGIVIGLPVALLSARVLSSMLVGVSPRDPLTFASVAGALLVTGVVAALIPARRASRVDPTIAIAEAS